MLTLLTAPMCQGCHAVGAAMKDLGLDHEERDIRTLTASETAEVIVALRVSGWSDKLIFAEVEGEMRPILQAPILFDGSGAVWPSLLVPDGRNVNVDLLRSLTTS